MKKALEKLAKDICGELKIPSNKSKIEKGEEGNHIIVYVERNPSDEIYVRKEEEKTILKVIRHDYDKKGYNIDEKGIFTARKGKREEHISIFPCKDAYIITVVTKNKYS